MLTTLALLALAPSARADDTLHPQVNASVQGTEALGAALALRGSGHFLWAPGPEDDTVLFFLYTGPKIHVTPWFSTAPQIGSVVGWNGPDGLLPLISTWNWVNLKRFHLFVEGDLYPNFGKKTVDYYGLYTADYDGLGIVSVGGQVEQVDGTVNIGPHIGALLGEVYVQVDWHYELKTDKIEIDEYEPNAIRFNLNVSL